MMQLINLMKILAKSGDDFVEIKQDCRRFTAEIVFLFEFLFILV